MPNFVPYNDHLRSLLPSAVPARYPEIYNDNGRLYFGDEAFHFGTYLEFASVVADRNIFNLYTHINFEDGKCTGEDVIAGYYEEDSDVCFVYMIWAEGTSRKQALIELAEEIYATRPPNHSKSGGVSISNIVNGSVNIHGDIVGSDKK